MKTNEARHSIVDIDTADRLKKIEQSCSEIPEIRKLLLSRQEETNPLGDWVTEKKATDLLQKKKTSLYKLRVSGELVYSETRPVFYSLSSLKTYLEKHKK